MRRPFVQVQTIDAHGVQAITLNRSLWRKCQSLILLEASP